MTMFESGWYPPGAEWDRNAPYNQCDEEVQAEAEYDVVYYRDCNSKKAAHRLYRNLVKSWQKNKEITDWQNIKYQFRKWKYGCYAQVEVTMYFNVDVTVYWNYCDSRTAPEPTSEDIRYAAEEQFRDILEVDGWEMDSN